MFLVISVACDDTSDDGGGVNEVMTRDVGMSDEGLQGSNDMMSMVVDMEVAPDQEVQQRLDMNITQSEDIGAEDMEAMELEVDMARASLTLELDAPADGMVYDDDQDIIVRGEVSVEGGSLEFVVVDASLDDVQSLPILIERDTGRLSAVINNPAPGEHVLTLRAGMAPDSRAELTHRFTVACETINDFNALLDLSLIHI